MTSAAHGGQVLVSEETAERCARVPGLGFVTVGRFRLRDFDEPVCLRQLTAPGLEVTFPAVRALPAEGHNVVRPANTFIGREEEADHVASLLQPGSLVTILGPGGVGKTRLALEVAVRVAEAWSDGVWVVDLSTLEDPGLVGAAIGAAIGGFARGAEGWDDIVDVLRLQNALIILDNTEVHAAECARLALALLRSCTQLGVLTTGREPLRVAGELIVRLAPLPVPAAVSDREEAERWAAVRLFLDRARAARPGFDFDSSSVAPVVAICRRLEGLPLAIEIAAARTSVLRPAEILAGLDDMHRMLRSRDRSLPERQRSMDALLDWSHRLLGAEEKAALRRLSIFGGGFSVEAATAAAADGSPAAAEVPELVWSLVDRSLINADLTADSSRYRFLDTVRQYGRRLLEIAHETEPVARRLSSWYLERLGSWRPADRNWIGDVQLELDNLRSIIPLVAPFDPDAAQQFACLIGRYFDAIQAYRAGIDELQRFATELRAETPGRVSLLTTLAHLSLRIGDVDAAGVALTEASMLNGRTGSPSWDDAGLARTAGELAMRTGELTNAASIAEAALGQALSPRARARMWNLLGLARSAAGDLQGAMAAFAEERDEHNRAGHEAFLAGAEGNLAEIALRLGDTAKAARHQRASLDLALALGQPVMVAYSLIVAAQLAASAEDWWTSVRLTAKADDMLKEIGQRLYDDDRLANEQLRVTAGERLGPETYAEAARSGLALDAPGAALLADRVLSMAGTTTPAANSLEV